MQRQRGAISPKRRLASQTMRELTLACVRGMPNCHPAATSWPHGTGLDDVSRQQNPTLCWFSPLAAAAMPAPAVAAQLTCTPEIGPPAL